MIQNILFLLIYLQNINNYILALLKKIEQRFFIEFYENSLLFYILRHVIIELVSLCLEYLID